MILFCDEEMINFNIRLGCTKGKLMIVLQCISLLEMGAIGKDLLASKSKLLKFNGTDLSFFYILLSVKFI